MVSFKPTSLLEGPENKKELLYFDNERLLEVFFSENRETRSFISDQARNPMRGTQADCEDIILPYYLQINVSRVKERNVWSK